MDDDTGCPWCGEDFGEHAGSRAYDLAMEAHAPECEVWLAEQSSSPAEA